MEGSGQAQQDQDSQMEVSKEEEVPERLEGLKKGDKNRTVEEDKRLQEQVVNYTMLGDLKDFEDKEEFKTDQHAFVTGTMKTMMGDPEDWLAQFNALNYLRIINKYHQPVLMEYLDQFSQFVKLSVENLRSNISKNALMFCTEFFDYKDLLATEKYRQPIIQFLEIVLPAIFLRTVYDKMFIAKEAKTAVANCLTNCVIPETLQITIKEGCQNKLSNKKLQEEAHISFLKSLVTGCDLNQKDHLFMVDGSENSKQFVEQLCIGYESATRIKKGSADILKLLDSKIKAAKDSSMPSLEELLKIALKKDISENKKIEEQKQDEVPTESCQYDEVKLNNIMRLFSTNQKTKVAPKKDFRSFLKQQKVQSKPSQDDDCAIIVADPKKDE